MSVIKRFWITFAVAVILDAVICIELPFNEDNMILIGAMVLPLAAIAVCRRCSKRASFVNLIVLIAYTALLGYNMLFNSAYGAGFTWWFYLLILNLAQFLALAVFLTIRQIEKRR